MKKRRLTQAQKKKLISLVVMVVVIAAAGILTYNGRSIQPLIEYFPFLEEIFPQQSVPAGAPASPGEEGVALRVHILDVGQADCILIQGPEKTMVIDGGESSDAPDIIQYLRDQGVERIDYYLNTHPHSDHYGGITQVMEAIPTGEFFHHPVPEENTPTTRGYQKLIQYLVDSQTKTTVLDPGDTIDLGGRTLEVLPTSEEDLEMIFRPLLQ